MFLLGTLYKFYGWTVVSASIPLNYICEILQSESVQIDMQQRGIGIVRLFYVDRGRDLIMDGQLSLRAFL